MDYKVELILNNLEEMINNCNIQICKYRKLLETLQSLNNLDEVQNIAKNEIKSEINLLTIRKETIKEIIVKIRLIN